MQLRALFASVAPISAGATGSAVDEPVSETCGGLLTPVVLAARVKERTPAQLLHRLAEQSNLKETMIVKWLSCMIRQSMRVYACVCDRTVSKADDTARDGIPDSNIL